MPEFVITIIIVIAGIIFLSIFFSFVPVGLFISARASGVKVGIGQLAAMRIRKVTPSRIINPMIKATKAGMDVPLNKLEAHYLAGGNVDTFSEAIKCLKPGGRIGNVNYLGSGDYVKIPRVEWGAGMSNKTISGGLMPGGRLRMEKLSALMTNGRLDVKPLITHVYDGWDALPQALRLMKDKPRDLIKPVVRL